MYCFCAHNDFPLVICKEDIMGSVTDGCHVCGRDSAYVNNKIVYCDGAECNLGVHQGNRIVFKDIPSFFF